jgi:hypothetical protein
VSPARVMLSLEINLPTSENFLELVSIVGTRRSNSAGDVVWYDYPAAGKDRLVAVIRLCGLDFIDQTHTLSIMNIHGGLGIPF